MIKRPLLWMLVAYCAGICFSGRPLPVATAVFFIYLTGGILYYKKPSIRRLLRKNNRFLVYLLAALLLGCLLAWNQQKPYKIDGKLLVRQDATVHGTVVSIERSGDGERVLLKDAVMELGDEVYCEGKILLWTSSAAGVRLGNRITSYGKASPLNKAENKGQFDEWTYRRAEWVACRFTSEKLEITDVRVHYIRQWFMEVRNRLEEIYFQILPEKHAGILDAILLGNRTLLEDETKTLYSRNGIAHILAISGLHISLLGMGLYTLLRRYGSPLLITAVLTVLLLVFYGFLTQFGISTARAVGMLILAMAAKLLGRSYDSRTAAAICAFGVLLIQPMQLYQAGFLLSYAAAFGISYAAGELRKMKLDGGIKGEKKTRYTGVSLSLKLRFKEDCRETLRKLRAVILSGVSVQLITIPIILNTYYELPVCSLPVNLFVVPLLSVLVLLGMTAGPIALLSFRTGRFLAGGVYYILEFYEWLCERTAQLPAPVFLYGKPEPVRIFLYYTVIVGFFLLAAQLGKRYQRNKNRKHIYRRYSVLILLLLPVVLIKIPLKELKIDFLSVGQGDCCVIQSPEQRSYLVDCGSLDVNETGRYRLTPFLKSEGISELEAVFLSHMDADHVKGVVELMETLPDSPAEYSGTFVKKQESYHGDVLIRKLIFTAAANEEDTCSELKLLAERKGIEVLSIAAGDFIQDGELLLQCLFPEKRQQFTTQNAASMILLLRYGGVEFYLTGDTEREGEEAVQKSLSLRTVQSSVTEKDNFLNINPITFRILKVAHHGSKNASSQEFLSALLPDVAVISCGRNNRYGHPHAELLERLDTTGCISYITAKQGMIRIRVKKRKERTRIAFWSFSKTLMCAD